MKKAIFVILDRFADWEASYLSMALNGEVTDDYLVMYASRDNNLKESIGGMTMLPDLTFQDVPPDADALILIGAQGSWWNGDHEDIRELTERFIRAGKVVGAICDAAMWLSSVGLANSFRHKPVAADTGGPLAACSLAQDVMCVGKVVMANCNAPVAFAAEVLRALDAAPEEKIRAFHDCYFPGFHMALNDAGNAAV
ncbi:MAG TPA: DJ-1/PfpI family protein [Candidatus Limnocylindria bacterium]|nr:DJ-1/PfpI family protein [Candidatus Limnocylindria bacterium]